ncbi:MAG: ABC transporter permease [Pseudobacter sp.]|uniref:ABC transporter permease n=1 Tax=Pseudobacter sp. TaxID=2045420 RepID=UPI003F7F058A
MLRNYFKTAWRNLLKNRFYTLLNIGGLAMGLAVGILILLWVQDEFSFDKFHKNSRNIYKVENMVGTGSSRQLWTNTVAPIGIMAMDRIPAVEAVVRTSYNSYYRLFRYKERLFHEQKNFYTDPSLFSVFDFKIIKGNAANPFPDAHSIVVTESIAKKYFDKENPIGKVIMADDKEPFTVSAVINDLPANTNIEGNIFFPMTLLSQMNRENGRNMENDFSNFDFSTWLLLSPGASIESLPAKLKNIHLGVKPEDTDADYILHPLEKVRLYRSDGAEGGIGTVQLFMVIAVLILVIACVNYVNLSTARAMLRAREVSLRKIVGAARWQLFMQFVAETALLFLGATIIALMLVSLLTPYFNQVSGKQLVVNFLDPQVWTVIGITIAGTLLLSGIYPALLLSSFDPLKALRGKITARVSDAVFRKALVVVQFSFSMILITGTIIVGDQLSYMRSKEMGFNKEHVFSMSLINMSGHLDAIRASLMKQPGITGVIWSSEAITNNWEQTGDNYWEGKMPGETMMISPMSVNQDFIPFFGMKLVAGKNFSGAVADSMHFILNETAVKAARLENPIGAKFKLWNTMGTVIGVVKDFHFQSLRQSIKPAIFQYRKPNHFGQLYIKTTGQDAPKALAAAEAVWKQYNTGFDFSYNFLDDSYKSLYKSEIRTGSLYNIFSMIAILISCLGLLGLVAYTAQVRTREIGVRKVLGATVPNIIRILAGDFIRLVGIGVVMAIPISWYVMNKWLEQFAYRTGIGWQVFAIAGITAFVIAIVTVSFQSIRAALANPVKSLRSE